MALSLARHDEIRRTCRHVPRGRLIKTRGEGDATFSVFDRPAAAAAAASTCMKAILHEPMGAGEPMRAALRLHTEVEVRDGDYFGGRPPARRLRSLAAAQIPVPARRPELVIARFPLTLSSPISVCAAEESRAPGACFRTPIGDRRRFPPVNNCTPWRSGLPAVLAGPGPSVDVAASSSDFCPPGRPRLAAARTRAHRGGTRGG